MIQIRGTVAIYFVLFLSGCVDTIDIPIPQDTGEDRLVIHGVVERSDKIYRFFVQSLSTQDLQSGVEDHNRDADIDLIYNGQPIFSLQSGSEFTIPIDSFHQLYGGTRDQAHFNIQVQVDGRVFESESQSILENPEGGALKLSYVEREELNDIENLVTNAYVKLLVSTPVVNSDNKRVSFLWDVSGVYLFREVIWTLATDYDPRFCYVTDRPALNEIQVLNSQSVNGEFVNDLEINETSADHRFASGYYYTVVQKAIDQRAAIYWDQLRKNIEREGTIYDPPAGIAQSNITQVEGPPMDVLGYFYTAGVDTLRHLSTRDETGNQPHLCALNIISEVCCDCILILNSTYAKPPYWDQ